jgi:3-hydroxyacyl-CoA dehydrogenase
LSPIEESGVQHSADLLAFSQTVSGRLAQNVLVLCLDNPPVNAASADMRSGLFDALAHAAEAPDITGVVITGAGRQFVGGADIREFGKPAPGPSLADVTARLEAMRKPVIAAINGAALGGGCEIALACHYRLAGASAKLGLPEVKLGIVPGAGGTQRLPRLIGLVRAAELIATGRVLAADEAMAFGLVDQLVEDDLVEAALAVAPGLASKPLRRSGEEVVTSQETDAMAQLSAKLVLRARGLPAVAEAVRLVALSAERPLAEGLAEERASFLRLRDSAEAIALRYVFFAERASAKMADLGAQKPRPIHTVGIAGMGLMGSGIALSCLAAGYEVIATDRDRQAAAGGRARIEALVARAVSAGRVDPKGAEAWLGRLSVGDSLEGLAPADLVIEAVFDDLTVKSDLFVQLDTIVGSRCILATNTSYLDPNVLAAATRRPDRVCGLHFFSPAHVMRLVEVVRCAQTAPDVMASALAFAKQLGKLPIVSGVCEGFIGNRIFSAYRREAEFLVEEGALPHEVDAAVEAYGFAMGPFAVFDLAGLEIAWARRKRQNAKRDPTQRYVDIADRLCEAGRFGQKSGRGWYAYIDTKRVIDPDVIALIEASRLEKSIVARQIPAADIVARLLAAMMQEGEVLLAEGVAARASDIDLVMINGYGFPASKGGPMFAGGHRAAG